MTELTNIQTSPKPARTTLKGMSRFGCELVDALKGPEKCRAITIEHRIGCVPTVTYVCLLSDEQMRGAVEVVKRFDLAGVEPAEVTP